MSVGDDVWFDRFLGGFYEAQHSHLATLGYDSAGRLFRISKDGTPAGASADDPFVKIERARAIAQAWGSRLEEIGNAGHVNGDAGFGPWPEGSMAFAQFLSKLPDPS